MNACPMGAKPAPFNELNAYDTGISLQPLENSYFSTARILKD